MLDNGTVSIRIPFDTELDAGGDGCALVGPEGPMDAITWGDPAPCEILPPSGPPLRPLQGFMTADYERYRNGDVLIRVPRTWPPSQEKWGGSERWIYRRADSATPGEPNPAPGPTRFSPEDGAHVESSFILYIQGTEWSAETTFQIATDQGFQDIVLEETVEGQSFRIEDFPEGTYHWRVRSYAGDPPQPGPWSESTEFTCEAVNIEVRNDSDGDGLVNFDEERRFRTDPSSRDTDLDGVYDMQDIVGYVFTSDGNYMSPPRNPDMDGDGAWKELDPDNDWADDSSMMDGCEDMDADGFYDAAIESDCFNHGDDFRVFNPECVTGLIVHDMRHFFEDEYTTLTGHWLESIVIEDEPLNSQGYVHRHVWSFSHIETPHPPPDISCASQYADEEGSGTAKVILEMREDGEYYARFDVQPSQASIETLYSWPELGEEYTSTIDFPFYFSLGPTYHLGKPVRVPDGALMLTGQLGPDGRAALLTRVPKPLDPDGTVIVWWEIILEHPRD